MSGARYMRVRTIVLGKLVRTRHYVKLTLNAQGKSVYTLACDSKHEVQSWRVKEALATYVSCEDCKSSEGWIW